MTSKQDPYDVLLERLRAAVQASHGGDDAELQREGVDPAREERLRQMARSLAAGDMAAFSKMVSSPEDSLALNREGGDEAEDVPELKEARRRIEEKIDEGDVSED